MIGVTQVPEVVIKSRYRFAAASKTKRRSEKKDEGLSRIPSPYGPANNVVCVFVESVGIRCVASSKRTQGEWDPFSPGTLSHALAFSGFHNLSLLFAGDRPSR